MSSEGPRTFGIPGASARAMMRTSRAQWLAASWRTRFILLVAAVLIGSLVSVVLGHSVWTGALFGLGVGTLLGVALAAPDAIAVVAVSLLYIPFISPLATLYSASAAQAGGVRAVDFVGATASLFVSYLVAVWVAVRWSRGRRWVTVAMVAASTIVPGVFFISLLPSLGLNIARLCMVAVLLFRCGGWGWIAGMVGIASDWVQAKLRRTNDDGLERAATKEDNRVLNAWGRRVAAEKATADLLGGLDGGFTVFHDIRVKKVPVPLGHLLVGPGGVFLIASVSSDGPLTETRRDGVTLPDVSLAQAAAALFENRRGLAKTMRTAPKDLAMVIVVHGDFTQVRKPLAVYENNDPLPAGTVMLLSADMVASEVSPGFVVWSKVRCAQAVRRVRMRTGVAAMPVAVEDSDASTMLVPIDEHGKSERPSRATTIDEDKPPFWMVDGAQCRAVTTLGVLTGLRICDTPYRDEDRWVVNVCREDEWQMAKERSRNPRAIPYPMVSIDRPTPAVADTAVRG